MISDICSALAVQVELQVNRVPTSNSQIYVVDFSKSAALNGSWCQHASLRVAINFNPINISDIWCNWDLLGFFRAAVLIRSYPICFDPTLDQIPCGSLALNQHWTIKIGFLAFSALLSLPPSRIYSGVTTSRLVPLYFSPIFDTYTQELDTGSAVAPTLFDTLTSWPPLFNNTLWFLEDNALLIFGHRSPCRLSVCITIKTPSFSPCTFHPPKFQYNGVKLDCWSLWKCIVWMQFGIALAVWRYKSYECHHGWSIISGAYSGIIRREYASSYGVIIPWVQGQRCQARGDYQFVSERINTKWQGAHS